METNQEDNDAKLEAVLHRTRERGIKLNPDKCVFRTNQVTYFGHIWSADGLRPDPVKTQGIRDMPSPTSREELETVLGMATYLGKFAPNLSDVTAPHRDLDEEGELLHLGRSKREGLQQHDAAVMQGARSCHRLL